MDSEEKRPPTPVTATPAPTTFELCYICREEHADQPDDTPQTRVWTHPCKCTLIAHEDCLLKWIQSSQSNTSRASNALKCPQCSTPYEIESKQPLMLKGLTLGNKVLQKCGTYVTLFGVATAFGVAGTSIYICLTAYGAYALEKFIGREMFNLILTDDPVNWPWSAYINLPLIPLSLILTRFQKATPSLVIPLLISWPPSPPVGEPARKLYEFWNKPENTRKLSQFPLFSSNTSSSHSRVWPPPPVLFGLIGVPIVKALYQRAYAWAYQKVLNTSMPNPINAPRGLLRFNEGPLVIRILANVDGNGAANGEGQGAGEGQGQGQERNEQENGQPNAGADEAEAGGDAVAAQAAEQLIEVNATSLGRKIAGALLVPTITNMMGSILFRLSRRSYILRIFLGIKQEQGANKRQGRSWVSSILLGNYSGLGSEPTKSIGDEAFSRPSSSLYPPLSWSRLMAFSPFSDNKKEWSNLSRLEQMSVGLQLVVNAFLGGSRMWVESDPVWWRNCIGFGIFIAVKDAIHLLHLWLKKRELESRRVKDRDFSGIDIRELDLLPAFLTRLE